MQTLWNERQRQLYKHQWVVYAKTPLGGPAQVLEYLSRYTHRTAISNERIRTVTAQEVMFTVRANNQGGKRLERLEGVEFVRRHLMARVAKMDLDACPCCKVGHLHVTAVLQGQARLPQPRCAVAQHSQGPP